MNYYFAPMEGITDSVFRRVHHKYFPGITRYYMPFISPTVHRSLTPREAREVPPADSVAFSAVPQLLTKVPEDFLWAAGQCRELGYSEVNLNLGCPSATVVTKRKGAGLLADHAYLEHFLEDIFREVNISISLKTRIGMESPEEFDDLLDLYNQFPVKELIVHPRVREDYYNNTPNWNAFGKAVEESKHKLCYNGDLFTVEDYKKFCAAFPQIDAVMLGRGILRNPGIVDEMKGNAPAGKKTLKLFHDEILEAYTEAFSGDRPVLFKMKELWVHMLPLLDPEESYTKKIRKAEKISEYKRIVAPLFE